jgi:hypothetical protein
MTWIAEFVRHRRRIAYHRRRGTFNPPRPLDCVVFISDNLSTLPHFLETLTARTHWPLRIWLCAAEDSDAHNAESLAPWDHRRIESHEVNVIRHAASDDSAGLNAALRNITADVCVFTEGLVVVPDLGKICWATTLLQLMFDFPHVGWLNASQDIASHPELALVRQKVVRGTRRTIMCDTPNTQLALVRRDCFETWKIHSLPPAELLQNLFTDKYVSGRAHSVIAVPLF